MVGSRVYVGGLPYGVRERDLERFFKGYGRTRDILLKNGYGFVEFEDHRDADDAVYELNGKELLGERVVVEAARGTVRGNNRDRYDDRYGRRGGGGRYNDNRNKNSSSRYGPPLRTEYRIVVQNLSSRVSWQDLKDYMRQAGEVTYADAHKQRRNEGVVEFASLSDMKAAIEKLDDTDLNGRRLRLVEDRRGGRGGGRGRSRSSSSRSRSRSRRRSRSRSRRSSRSRSKSHSRSRSRSNSKSPVKSRTRSRSNKSRVVSKSKSRSRSRSRSANRDSRSRSRSNSKRGSRSRSRSKSRRDSRSRERSVSRDKKSRFRSRSISPKNGNASADRNESMDE
ncbi:serine-arginine protein 55 [Eurosta solidaginis]|uniref:serine-arginine protein 55 n=1 Tax=Eurosta solidaginis TaxID=178769 RepID=UPI003530CE75